MYTFLYKILNVDNYDKIINNKYIIKDTLLSKCTSGKF